MRSKIRSRKFEGRCARHKRYNPAVDGQGGVKAGCLRCNLLFEIWEASLKLNQLIRKFDPSHEHPFRPEFFERRCPCVSVVAPCVQPAEAPPGLRHPGPSTAPGDPVALASP